MFFLELKSPLPFLHLLRRFIHRYIQSGAARHALSFVLFSLEISGYQWGCIVAAALAQQNIANDGQPLSVHVHACTIARRRRAHLAPPDAALRLCLSACCTEQATLRQQATPQPTPAKS